LSQRQGAGRTAARLAFDALERGLARLAAAGSPRRALPALGAAAAAGRIRNRLSGAWPSLDQVVQLFPHLDRAAAARVARTIGGAEARNRLLVELVRRRGLPAAAALVRSTPALAALQPPLVLCTFHVGAVQALGAALERLPAPVLLFRHGLLHTSGPPLAVISTAGSEAARARAFLLGLDHLRRGGFVALAADLAESPVSVIATRCLGRPLDLARGPFALARLAAAPLRPIVVRWSSRGLDTVVGPPLVPLAPRGPLAPLSQLTPLGPLDHHPNDGGPPASPPADLECEAALAGAAAAWLERRLLAAPGDLSLGLLRALLGAA
jgi:hypothetical protein